MTRLLILYFVFFVLLQLFGIVLSNSNDPIEANDLGNTSRDCVAKYCPSFNSVDFWYDIKTVCYTDTSVKALSQILEEEEDATTEDVESTHFTPHQVGLLCATVTVIGLVAGYFVEELLKKSHFLPTPRYGYANLNAADEKQSLISSTITPRAVDTTPIRSSVNEQAFNSYDL